MSGSLKDHWNRVYATKPVNQLGWYESEPTISLAMIERCSLDRNAPILDVGAGATTLLDYLIELDYRNITALDISKTALENLQTRLGPENAVQVRWLIEDITHPSPAFYLKDIALWHDRAMLHFLTTQEEQQAYLSVLKKVVRVDGFGIIAAFAKDGATQCSGLGVVRYDTNSLQVFLGEDFALCESQETIYQMPTGDLRPFIYARFQKLA
jgi:SAM-dependent methyltransferase